MDEILTSPTLKDFLTSLAAGDINFMTGLVWLVLAAALSLIGGAIGGVLVGGKDLGNQLAAMIGGLFGPAGVIPAVLIGLVILRFVG
ncbi:hypothetical protein [Microseira wollei]|uniref:Uncharacterized protein n=1 Tax=Microseira wollei NIES-4236 TaxID=2530354 RepID=A0AAV3XNY5_9CYAN|nr:hypothetical protein [Microseira wollei]GET43416.1 hypothetical protein MiSe_82390 [Microseira wollei NIES-4236]